MFKKIFIAYFFILSGTISVFAQTKKDFSDIGFDRKIETNHKSLFSSGKVCAPQPTPSQLLFDVLHYEIDIAFNPARYEFEGSVRTVVLSLVDSLYTLDFNADYLNLLEIREIGGELLSWNHNKVTNILSINLNKGCPKGEQIEIEMDFSGGFLSKALKFDSYNGNPIIYSFAEPWDAKSWFPCKDFPDDKATFEIYYSVPANLFATSNGNLIDYKDETRWDKPYRRYHWRENYPMSTYNLMIAASDYVRLDDYFVYAPGDTMPITHYVYPSKIDAAKTDFDVAPSMLEFFSSKFGLYPFVKEKYGVVLWNHEGAMEHQTMTSLWDDYVTGKHESDDAYAHELAHQWFGNCITCKDWVNVWLNEGFATYASALWFEHVNGFEWLKTYMLKISKMKSWFDGPVLREEDSNYFSYYFDYVVYYKGAAILHMLRHIVGDETFFKILQSYINNPKLRYGTAETKDFIYESEKQYGASLDWFFTPWLTRSDSLQYQWSWKTFSNSGNTDLVLVVEQLNEKTYKMPVDFRIKTETSQIDTMFWIEKNHEEFHITLSENVQDIELDPDNWIMCNKTRVEFTNAEENNSSLFFLSQNLPNPFNPSTTITFSIPESGNVSVEIFNVTGQKVKTLVNGFMSAGEHSVKWDANGFSAGVYFYKVKSGKFERTMKMTLLK